MAEEKKAREPKDGVGKAAMEAILAGKTNEEAFKAVQAKFPEAKTSMASINWYRNKLRADGHSVKTSREIRAAQPKAEKPAKQKGAATQADPLS